MIHGNIDELDKPSKLIAQLMDAKNKVQLETTQLEAVISTQRENAGAASRQLMALRNLHKEAQTKMSEDLAAAKATLEEDLKKANSSSSDSDTVMLTGGAAGLAGLVILASGGVAAIPLLIGGSAATFLSKSLDETSHRTRAISEAQFTKTAAEIESAMLPQIVSHRDGASRQKFETDAVLAALKTAEQRRLYFGTVAQILIDNGINVTRQLNQFARFNNTNVDAVFAGASPELRPSLERLFRGIPSATDIDLLVERTQRLDGPEALLPEQRALKQFVNQVVIANRTYFKILSSYADDVRDKDLATFPPLEILGHKPIAALQPPAPMSPDGAATPLKRKDGEPESSEQHAARARARAMVRETVARSSVLDLSLSDGQPIVAKMEALAQHNDQDIAAFAEVFSEVERAVARLEQARQKATGESDLLKQSISESTKGNRGIDGKVAEITARNNAKQLAGSKGALVRGAATTAVAAALVIFDAGTLSGPMAAHGLAQMSLGSRFARDSLNSLTFGAGQAVATRVENGALNDYMLSLKADKVDLSKLGTELKALQDAIEKTRTDEKFQGFIRDEAKSARAVQAYLMRSLIRSGLNNARDLDDLSRQHGLASADVLLDHYKGQRLGLALKKHCHGVSDSNDIAIILAEADALHGELSGPDKALREYVEDVMKPNIAAVYSRANKMDLLTESHASAFGNELTFRDQLQHATNDAVRTLLMANEAGMSVIGREDVRATFDFWLHRHGDKRLYDEKIRDGEMADEYPAKRVNMVTRERMEGFVDMAKRSVASGRTSFPKVGDMFMRICAYEYFLPQSVHTGGKDNIFTDHPESPTAYPMVNEVVSEFVRRLSFSGIDDYRGKIGERLDNVIAQSFIDFFAKLGTIHDNDPKMVEQRDRVRDTARYEDYGASFDRLSKSISRDATQRFDQFLDIYRTNLEKQLAIATLPDRAVLEAQIDAVKDLADGKLNPKVVRPGSHEARLIAHDEAHTGENLLRRG